MSPLVTIGLPVYNSERYIRQSLDSLLGQTFSNFVLIISDNASTDTTPQICRQYAADDSRVRYFRNEHNIGNPRNFNRVFELSSTPYLKWSTADDYWEPTFLERAVEVMEADPTIALCYPKTYLVDANGANPTPYEDNLQLLQEDPVERFVTVAEKIGLSHQHLGLIRTSMLRKTHLLGYHVGSDINLLAELSLYGKYVELPERLFYRRFHEKSGSWKRGDAKHEAELYYAQNAKRVAFKRWRSHFAFMAASGTSPISAVSKLRLYRRLLKLMMWDRNALVGEIVDYARFSMRVVESKLRALV
jgi:glycosyltransferase involved in cell wall biosynthesis